MAATAHTPGPWNAEPMTGRGAWVKGSSGEWAALSCGDTDATAEANARLIAAAPDLLAALKKIVFDWDGEPEDMIEAQEAIAKAEGRS